MCEYCRERGKRKNILDEDELTIKIKKERVLGYSIRVELKKSQKYNAISTNIKFCPMCGRKLIPEEK